MTAITVRLTVECATVSCDACGHSLSQQTADRAQLIACMRDFLDEHAQCRPVRAARTP
jgi:transcription elongation factor Elf1